MFHYLIWFAFKDLLQTSRHDQSNKTFHPVELLLSPLLAASLMESLENHKGGRGVCTMCRIGGSGIVTRFTQLSHCSGEEVH